MEVNLVTDKKALVLEITVLAPQKTRCELIIYDPTQKNTVYCNRVVTIDKSYLFKIPMPLSPDKVKIYSNCQITNIARKSIQRKFTKDQIPNYMIKSFVEFVEEFCQKAGYLNAPRKYSSDNGVFTIEYYPVLKTNGKVSLSPCRIRSDDGVIEASKDRFIRQTVYERIAWLFHEYMHVYKNKNANSEEESDRNSLFLYLGLGYPKYDAYKCWLGTFIKSRNGSDKLTEPHKQRLVKIKNIIDKFDDKFQTITFLQ